MRRTAPSSASGILPAGGPPCAAASLRTACAVAAVWCALALPLAAQARAADLTADERAVLEERIAVFERAVATNDVVATVAAFPPAVVVTIARANGITPAEVRPRLARALAGSLQVSRVESFEMDEDAVRVETTRDGLVYVLVPSAAVVELAGLGRFLAKDETLALQEFETWFFLRLDSPQQIASLVQTYPAFEGVAFARGTITALPAN